MARDLSDVTPGQTAKWSDRGFLQAGPRPKSSDGTLEEADWERKSPDIRNSVADRALLPRAIQASRRTR